MPSIGRMLVGMGTATAPQRDHLRVSYEDDRGHLLIDGPAEMFRDYLRMARPARCAHECPQPPRDGEPVAMPEEESA